MALGRVIEIRVEVRGKKEVLELKCRNKKNNHQKSVVCVDVLWRACKKKGRSMDSERLEKEDVRK